VATVSLVFSIPYGHFIKTIWTYLRLWPEVNQHIVGCHQRPDDNQNHDDAQYPEWGTRKEQRVP